MENEPLNNYIITLENEEGIVYTVELKAPCKREAVRLSLLKDEVIKEHFLPIDVKIVNQEE